VHILCGGIYRNFTTFYFAFTATFTAALVCIFSGSIYRHFSQFYSFSSASESRKALPEGITSALGRVARSTALPKDRRLGSVGLQGSESVLDQPSALPNSLTLLGEHTLPTGSSISSPTLRSLPNSTQIHSNTNNATTVVRSPFPTLLVESENPTIVFQH